MFDSDALDELDATATCALLDQQHRALVGTEIDIANTIAHWADLHECAWCEEGEMLRVKAKGGERGKVFGGEGNPELLEFCVGELAALQGVHPATAVSQLADIQDLRYRHPLLWHRFRAGTIRLFQARQIVVRTRHLSAEAARLVDARIVDAVGTTSWSRFITLLDAAIIAADPATAEALRNAEERSQFVRRGRTTEHGMTTITVKTHTAAVVWYDGMCGHIAKILGHLGDTDSLDMRRAKAFTLLGHPEQVLLLFQRYLNALQTGEIDPADRVDPWEVPDGPFRDPHANPVPGHVGEGDIDPSDDGPEPEATDEPLPVEPGPDAIGEADVHPGQNDAGDPDPACPACNGVGRLNPMSGDPTPFVKVATSLDTLDWRKLLPNVTFYVHTSREAFAGRASDGGVVRVEGHGPLTLQQAKDFFGGDTHQITIREVIDPAGVRPVDAYETPDWMREIVHLLSPGDVFPYANHVGRHVDLDHVEEYVGLDRGGPPGQTHPDNLAPMIRFHHRLKTHGNWQIRRVEPGVHLWRSPHGYYFQVGPTGTHRLTPQAGQLLWDHSARTRSGHSGAPLPDRPHGLDPPSPMESHFIRLLYSEQHQHRPPTGDEPATAAAS